MEVLAGVWAFILNHELLFVTLAFALSEFLGQTKLVKENGVLALIFNRVLGFLRQRGAVDLTPNDSEEEV